MVLASFGELAEKYEGFEDRMPRDCIILHVSDLVVSSVSGGLTRNLRHNG
jgi:hypothetical protein